MEINAIADKIIHDIKNVHAVHTRLSNVSRYSMALYRVNNIMITNAPLTKLVDSDPKLPVIALNIAMHIIMKYMMASMSLLVLVVLMVYMAVIIE